MKQLFESIQFKILLVFLSGFLLISLTSEANEQYGIMHGGKGLIFTVCGLTSICYAMVMARFDSTQIIKNHIPRAIVRCVLLGFVPVALWMQGHGPGVLSLGFYNLSLFYFFFDGLYSEYKDGNPYTLGTTSYIDRAVQWLDNHTFLGKVAPAWLLLLKLLLVIFSIILVTKTYLR